MLDFIHQHGWAIARTALVAVAATVAVIGVTALTGGLGAPLLVPLLGATLAPVAGTLLAGAAGGAAGYLANYGLSGPSRKFSLKDFLITTALSGVLSFLGGAILSALAPVASTTATVATTSAVDAATVSPAAVAVSIARNAAVRVAKQASLNAAIGGTAGFGEQVAANGYDVVANHVKKSLLAGTGYAAESGAVAGASAAVLGGVNSPAITPAMEASPEATAVQEQEAQDTSSEAAAGIVQVLERGMGVGSAPSAPAPASPASAATPKGSAVDTGGNAPSGETEDDKKGRKRSRAATLLDSAFGD